MALHSSAPCRPGPLGRGTLIAISDVGKSSQVVVTSLHPPPHELESGGILFSRRASERVCHPTRPPAFKMTKKVLPWPGLLFTPMRPPCATVISRAMDRPRRAPVFV